MGFYVASNSWLLNGMQWINKKRGKKHFFCYVAFNPLTTIIF